MSDAGEFVVGTDGHGGHWVTGERIVRCRDCRFFWPAVADVASDWCSQGDGRAVTPYDFCSYAEKREERHGEGD